MIVIPLVYGSKFVKFIDVSVDYPALARFS